MLKLIWLKPFQFNLFPVLLDKADARLNLCVMACPDEHSSVGEAVRCKPFNAWSGYLAAEILGSSQVQTCDPMPWPAWS